MSFTRRSWGAALLAAAFTFQPVSGFTQTTDFDAQQVGGGKLDPKLVVDGWVLLTKRGVTPTVFSKGDATRINVETRTSNALIYKKLNNSLAAGSAEAAKELSLRWRWRVDAFSPGNGRGSDPDWPVAVYAAFDVDKRHVSWWRRVVNRLTLGAAGLPSSGKILTYTWSPQENAGAIYPNPYIPKIGAIQVLQGAVAQQGEWYSESRDLHADFEQAFGHPAKQLLFIAISADGEDRGINSRASVEALRVN